MATDINGIELEVGDLVVSSTVTSYSNMVVGIVSYIGEKQYGSTPVTITYSHERNQYAYEIGAPKVEEKYREWGQHKGSDGRWTYGYHGPEKTRMVNDMRVVGKTIGVNKQARQKSCNILIIRRKDGTTPQALLDTVERHKLIYPGGTVVGTGE